MTYLLMSKRINMPNSTVTIPVTLIKEVFFGKIEIFKFIPFNKIENTTFY